MFGFPGYVLGNLAIWIVGGALTDAHKGAAAAGGWGFLCTVVMAVGLFGAASSWRRDVTKSAAWITVVILTGLPTALLLWGTHNASGGGAFWTFMGFVAAA